MDYDAENRLVSVTGVNGTNLTAMFVYNGDGQRVKSVINGSTTLFVGGYYEVLNPGIGQLVTKYYYAGASRIAMNKYSVPATMEVEYFLGDHLGSTGITTDNTGAKVSEMRYEPWGEVRYSWTANQSTTPAYTLPKYTFTGQYSYMDDPSTSGVEGFGLMDYNARMYDPAIGRFVSADTVVPNNIQGLDRYAYVRNSPVRYTDPSGHDPSFDNCDYAGFCDENGNPLHLTIDGQLAWAGLHAMGLFGKDQEAMEYVVASEYGGFVDAPNSVWFLSAAMVRRYSTWCTDGLWSADCINNFWGYMQGVREPIANPQDKVDSHNEKGGVTKIANAILNPGGSAFSELHFNLEWTKGECDKRTDVLCHWAVIYETDPNDPHDYYSDIESLSYANGSYGNTAYVIPAYGGLLVVLTTNQLYADYEDYHTEEYNYSITTFGQRR